ncbi:winged helix-turn-helix transcriptional regulator [Paenibacillus sp. GP183]|uniref:winged helix-turn-helix transcriptional regulator n=1 Tax=Paenibacillus sp. GP183 TaxID=1882751 RepID=UPI00089BE9BD|nr:winged helix-turn-helix transcriptional regulator [Paenibacillus sp. GP183]SEC80953.1 transcriptional regulator, HxlR family [Paenibacillus sp. GP183]
MSKRENVLRISQELSGQWIIPVLLTLEDCGGRFTPLQRHLETTPARLSDNLKRMIEGGLIKHLSPFERHHPLFPEYVLTEKGRLYREAGETIQQAEADMGYGRLSAKAWNIPVLLALDFGYERFQEIRLVLQQVTPRMLSIRLDELNSDGLIIKLISEQPRLSFLYRLAEHIKKPVHHLSVDLSSLL